MKTQVLYMSRTGNTEKIAQAIFQQFQEKTKILQGLQGKPTMIWEIFILLVLDRQRKCKCRGFGLPWFFTGEKNCPFWNLWNGRKH